MVSCFSGEDPLISVLVPVYNRELYIVECIDSILSQDLVNFEVVVVDNKSTDNTWALCQEYASKDSRVRVFQNDSNIGPVLNWMRCAQEARGEFSKIVFSDDLLLDGCLKKMYSACKEDNVGFSFSAAKIGASVESAKVFYQNESDSLICFGEYVDRLLNHLAPLSPGAIMLRTDDLRKNLLLEIPTSTPRNFLKNGAGPDVLISLITAHGYSRVACIREPLVFFRAHEGSFSITNSNDEVVLGYISAISYFLKFNAPQYWVRYIALSWIRQMVKIRAWVWPRKYLIQYNGVGNGREILMLFVASIKHILLRFFKRG